VGGAVGQSESPPPPVPPRLPPSMGATVAGRACGACALRPAPPLAVARRAPRRSAMGGRIECVFFSEFHPTLGPKITYQV